MTPQEAFDICLTRMAGAPNYEHYRQWLLRQTPFTWIKLATGQTVHSK